MLCWPAFSQAHSQPTQGRNKCDFDYATVHSNVSALFGTNVDVGQGLSDLLVNNLVQDGTCSVTERKALHKILAEQNFSKSDRANAGSAAKLGKLLGVDTIVVDRITQFGNETKLISAAVEAHFSGVIRERSNPCGGERKGPVRLASLRFHVCGSG